MDNWPDDMEVPPQSSRAGNSNVFEGLDDLVDLNAVSSSGHHSKRLKKCNARKQVTPPGQPGKLPKKKVGKKPPVNPLEPVRASWVKVKAKEFKKDRLLFNPYAFGQPTCLDDNRFYCKMHQQVFQIGRAHV